MCRKCNNSLSVAELELLCSGPEAIASRFVSTGSARTRRRRLGGIPKGAEPPRLRADFDGDPLLIDIVTKPEPVGRPPDQLVVTDKGAGKLGQVRLYPGMRPEQLQREVDRLGFDSPQPTRLALMTHDVGSQYEVLVREVWPHSGPARYTTDGADTRSERKVSLSAKVKDGYFRAIA
jgi:hypothetical protein